MPDRVSRQVLSATEEAGDEYTSRPAASLGLIWCAAAEERRRNRTANRRVDVTEFIAWAKACGVAPQDAFPRFLHFK